MKLKIFKWIITISISKIKKDEYRPFILPDSRKCYHHWESSFDFIKNREMIYCAKCYIIQKFKR